MKITLVVATSLDGYINHLGEKHASDWTSPEDQRHFAALLKKSTLLLMGSTTYLDNKDGMNFTTDCRRIVFTHTPKKYTAVPGVLEFTNESIVAAIARLTAEGVAHALLVGGGKLYTQFLKAGLVDELYQTIEPLTFGHGIPFLTDGYSLLDFPYLKLERTELLNKSGTKLLRYSRTE